MLSDKDEMIDSEIFESSALWRGKLHAYVLGHTFLYTFLSLSCHGSAEGRYYCSTSGTERIVFWPSVCPTTWTFFQRCWPNVNTQLTLTTLGGLRQGVKNVQKNSLTWN
jgi:hypothetical protein